MQLKTAIHFIILIILTFISIYIAYNYLPIKQHITAGMWIGGIEVYIAILITEAENKRKLLKEMNK